jgi:hypothetical protein
MHLGNTRGLTWGLVGVASLAACGTVRTELCTTVHTRVLEELRTTDGTARYVLDPWACELHSRRLHELAEVLRALEIRDAPLLVAVEEYRAEVEHLSEAYALLAAAYKASVDLPPEERHRVHSALSHSVQEHAASLNAPRAKVQSACTGL